MSQRQQARKIASACRVMFTNNLMFIRSRIVCRATRTRTWTSTTNPVHAIHVLIAPPPRRPMLRANTCETAHAWGIQTKGTQLLTTLPMRELASATPDTHRLRHTSRMMRVCRAKASQRVATKSARLVQSDFTSQMQARRPALNATHTQPLP